VVGVATVVGVVAATGVVVGALDGRIVVVTAPPDGAFVVGDVGCCATVVVACVAALPFGECGEPEPRAVVVVDCPFDLVVDGVVGECTELDGTLVEVTVVVVVEDARFAALAK
jgi:hypothetical protein